MVDFPSSILYALLGGFFAWLFVALWDIYRGPTIALETTTINTPDDFKIKLRNKGSREASECMVILETAPLSEAKRFLQKFLKPTGRRMEYIDRSKQ